MAWNWRVFCQATARMTAPTATGATESPILAPMPCTEIARPRRSGNCRDREPAAEGCHRDEPSPNMAAPTRAHWYDPGEPSKKAARPNARIDVGRSKSLRRGYESDR